MKIVDINNSERDCVDAAIDPNYPGFVKVDFESKNRKGYTHSEWYPIKEFIGKNPSFSKMTKDGKKIPEEDLGIVTSASSITIQDKTKQWDKNVFAGYCVWISRGPGEGQVRNVLNNSTDTLIVDRDWNIIPEKVSQYVISNNVHNPQPLGNDLPGYPAKVEKIKKSSKSKKK